MLKASLCLILLIFHYLPGLSQEETIYSYSENFSIKDGLSHTAIGDLTTDENDLLWIAVNGTLQLFDGDQFIEMGHLIHPSIHTGSFGYDYGKNVFLLKDHILYKLASAAYTAHQVPQLKLPPFERQDHPPKIIFEDAVYLYISHPNDSLYQVDKDLMQLHKAYPLPHKPNRYAWSSVFVSPVPDNVIHYIDADYKWCQYDLSTLQLSVDQRCPNVWRAALASGDTLLVVQTDTLEIYSKDQKLTIPLPEPARDFNGDPFLLSGRDSVFVVGRDAIYLFNLRTLSWVRKINRNAGSPLKEIKVRRMMLDKSGHLYFSTFFSGMVKLYLSQSGFEYMSTPGEKKYFIKCIKVSEKNNLVLAGTLQDGLLVFDTSGVLKHHIQYNQQNAPIKLISAIIKFSESRYLLFGDRSYDITFKQGEYNLNEVTEANRYLLTYYDSALEDTVHHRYFLVNHRYFTEIAPDHQRPLQEIPQPYTAACLSATIGDDHYVISRLNELVFYDQSLNPHIIKFNVPDFGYSRCIVHYQASQYLVATDLGLFLLDTLNPNQANSPIFEQRVYSILPGHKKNEFWFSTDWGLYHLNSNLEYSRYSIESGLQENEFNTNSCFKSESGKLYFGGVNGITAFYPDRVSREEDHPAAYISTLNINGEVRARYLSPGISPVYDLAYNENVILIRLLGKGLRSPKNYNFQYRIKELHDGWINLGRNMEIQFQLPPGHYTLYYHIADKFQADAEAVQAIRFNIRPPLYARWWFRLAFFSLALLGFYLILNARRKQQAINLQHEKELQQNLFNDRLRISRELHDNIGAQMATVKRNLNFMLEHRDRLTEDQKLQKMQNLEEISTQINQELRDTIWVTQNAMIPVGDFISRIKAYVFQMLGPESQIRVIYDERCASNVTLGPFVALNIHRICQEAINNIIKHAEATEMKITFHSSDHQLNVTISDNGKGYNASLDHDGYGLNNMRKRAEQIGAELYFNRFSETGSRIEIILPLLNTKEPRSL